MQQGFTNQLQQQYQQQLLLDEQNVLEPEHSIGFSGKIHNSVYFHPNGKDFVYISGCCIVITDLNDPHKQDFLREHDDSITTLAIGNLGKLIASGQKGDNSDVIIWDFEQRKPLFKLSEHDWEVVTVQFSHDDKLLFSAGNPQDKKIFIWDTTNGFIVASCLAQPERIQCMSWGGYAKDIKGRDTNLYQFATSGSTKICLWKLDSQLGQFDKEFINTGSMIRDYICMKFSKNKEEFLFAGTKSGDFCVFYVKQKSLVTSITVAAQGVQSLYPISANQIMVGCGQGTVAIYQNQGSQFNKILQNELMGSVKSISVSQNQQESLCATDKGFIYRIRNQDMAKVLHCENHVDSITFLAYPEGVSDKFASASVDGTIRLWDIQQDYLVTTRCMQNNAGPPLCMVYNDEIILSGWQDGKIRLFSTESGKLIWQIDNAHKGGVTSICMAKNLKFFVSGGQEGEVRVWEMKSREMVSHLKEHTSKVTKVRLTKDEMHIISASKDRALLVWDLKLEKRVSAHIQRMGGINSFDVVSGSNIVVTTGQDQKITFWDLSQPNPLRSFNTSQKQQSVQDEVMDLSISHDGKYFVTGGTEEVVKVWDIQSGQIVGKGQGHSGPINSVAFSYDDRQIVSGGRDGNIFLWNVFID
ncbi:WD40-repeat-containing domain [Pseudocohnilembus persalinus]|uniref:WD40-repeat-containing domain n=1 Tax=Pseudocohnilembus persalinus TaxID=266149 RepID=A0A0V0R8T2_PSEPJ|nr:WD40-repeat-containing domain [Pseudocohnilembus persalinus]|eukprot:KRX10889.1 WD40-repeat-containing domain [Pseudocohnilembus persalinus]